jgi:hypothetical protein
MIGLMAAAAVSAQPFTFTPQPFAGELQEAMQRVQSNFSGFVFNFAKGKVRLVATHKVVFAVWSERRTGGQATPA